MTIAKTIRKPAVRQKKWPRIWGHFLSPKQLLDQAWVFVMVIVVVMTIVMSIEAFRAGD
jgi:hypothetical protein